MVAVSDKQKFNKIEVFKVDEDLGLVFGWGIISTIDGEMYWDSQEDHIPEETMLKSVTDFMIAGNVAKEMHTGDGKGVVLFSWPLTTEIAKAMDIQSKYTGWMIAMKPHTEEILQKFKSGEYTGFSIGGRRLVDEEIDE